MSITQLLYELDYLDLERGEMSSDIVHQIIDHYKEGYEVVKLKEAYTQSKTKATKTLLLDTKNRYERYLYYITDWSELPNIQPKIIHFIHMHNTSEKNTRLQRLKLMRIIDYSMLHFLQKNSVIYNFDF